MRKIKRFGVEQLRTSPVSAPENIFKMHFPTRKMTKGLAELVMVGTTGEERLDLRAGLGSRGSTTCKAPCQEDSNRKQGINHVAGTCLGMFQVTPVLSKAT